MAEYDNVKCTVILNADLTAEERLLAYKTMGVFMIGYSRKHTVSRDVAKKLVDLNLGLITEVFTVMY